MASQPQSIYSWPPNPNLISFHILSRSVAILTDAIGIGVCFASGAESSEPSGFVAGAFMSFSILIEPLFIIWNVRQMRRTGGDRPSSLWKRTSGYERLESNDHNAQIQQLPSTRFLKFAIFTDALGFIAYLVVFSFTIIDATRWWYGRSTTMLMAYASVSVLVCVVVHALLLLTQGAQLWSATAGSKLRDMRCPHCNHRMGSMMSLHTNGSDGNGSGSRSRSETSTVHVQPRDAQDQNQNLLGQDLVDADPDAVPIADMSPGQVTGTCQITPRVSESSPPRNDSPATANERGEGENDRLIEKSK